MASTTTQSLNPKQHVVFDQTLAPAEIIKSPVSTEKAIRQIEFENKLVFVVDSRATKQDVKRAVESLFKVNVLSVNIHNFITGEKRAYVKLKSTSNASDVSADLGMI